jgi:hypothetical protein
MTDTAFNLVFPRLEEAEERVLKARRIIMGLLMDTPFDFEHQADAFLKATEEYEDE